MLDLIRYIYCRIRCCLHCGSFVVNESLLCSQCEEVLEAYKAPASQRPDFLRSLFVWEADKSDILSSLMLALKGAYQRHAFNYYSDRFIRLHIDSLYQMDRKIIVVPAPSKNGKPDHAYYWGQSLANTLGAIFFPCLEFDVVRSQRFLDKAERAQVALGLNVSSTLPDLPEGELLWVFADDIYTTGATALAAHRALGSPVNFEVWTLSQRALSCGDSVGLL